MNGSSEPPSELDLQALYEYRRSFSDAYDTVFREIRDRLGLAPTGRRLKTIPSLRAKLRRESVRLTQIQDIAGCRLVVSDTTEQDRVVSQLQDLFPNSRVIDRRATPSHRYRAVHVVAEIAGKSVEIQVRTSMQQRWAELSERWSDVDPDIKYGGGNPQMREILLLWSDIIYNEDLFDRLVRRLGAQMTELAEGNTSQDSTFEVRQVRTFLDEALPRFQELRATVDSAIGLFERRTS